MSTGKTARDRSKGGARRTKRDGPRVTADEARNAGRKGGQVSRGGTRPVIIPSDASQVRDGPRTSSKIGRMTSVRNDRFDRANVLEATNKEDA